MQDLLPLLEQLVQLSRPLLIVAEDLGEAKKVTIDKDLTTIVEGGGLHQAIEGRVK